MQMEVYRCAINYHQILESTTMDSIEEEGSSRQVKNEPACQAGFADERAVAKSDAEQPTSRYVTSGQTEHCRRTRGRRKEASKQAGGRAGATVRQKSCRGLQE